MLGERLAPQGIAATFAAWKQGQSRSKTDRETFYGQFLKSQIEVLAQSLNRSLDGFPLVVSGMASSSIGLAEVPYATLPFALDGSGVCSRWLEARPDFNHRMLLLSGVSSGHDVMRGEETQLIGLRDALPAHAPGVLIMPGTHSKHLHIQDDFLSHFQTFMTGEVFEAMITHTILRESVDPTDLSRRLAQDQKPFDQGVRAGCSGNLLQRLFTVRTNQLFGHFNRTPNALYMSGLLIGSELGQLTQNTSAQLILCGDNNLAPFYERALFVLGMADRTTAIPADRMQYAAIAGQLTILQHQANLIETTS